MRPISRRELIRRFRSLGFEGPYSGGRHAFMKRGQLKIRIPHPHAKDISAALQQEILRQAGIREADWESA